MLLITVLCHDLSYTTAYYELNILQTNSFVHFFYFVYFIYFFEFSLLFFLTLCLRVFVFILCVCLCYCRHSEQMKSTCSKLLFIYRDLSISSLLADENN